MSRSHIISISMRALVTPLLFLLSITIIFYRNDYAISLWVLVIVVEVIDLIYRRVRRSPHREVQTEADV